MIGKSRGHIYIYILKLRSNSHECRSELLESAMARRSSSGTGIGLQPPSMASLPNMYSCWKSYWALQLWVLCVLSSLQLSWTAISWNQCSSSKSKSISGNFRMLDQLQELILMVLYYYTSLRLYGTSNQSIVCYGG